MDLEKLYRPGLELSNSTITWYYPVTEQKIAKNCKKTKVASTASDVT